MFHLTLIYSSIPLLTYSSLSFSFVSQVPGQPQNQPQPQPQPLAETSSSAPRTSDPPVPSTSAGVKTVGPLAAAVVPPSAGTTSVNGDKPPVAVAPTAVTGAAAAAAQAGAAAAAADKGRPSNSFEKIMLRLSTMYPNFTRYCHL